MWTTHQLSLALLMLITGSLNTLSTKWADKSTAVGSDHGPARQFDHPFLQAVGMFLGEFSCLIVFNILVLYRRYRGNEMEIGEQRFSRFIFLPAALCDMCATSIMYVGLNLTYASSFQMLRGAVIIFTAMLSVAFLRRTIRSQMWFGMLLIIMGLILVGMADMLFGHHDASTQNKIITGDLLIVIAQVIVAAQMVYEEKYVMKHDVPALQAVGWEGFFGMTILGCLLVPMYYIRVGKPISNGVDGRLENAIDAFAQMANNPVIVVATIGNIVSIAFFNFSGISVTKELSATTRMVLDSCRTVVIWVVSMAVGWQPLVLRSIILQLVGFVLLVGGIAVYNFLPPGAAGRWLRRARGLGGEGELEGVTEGGPEINYSLADDERSPLIQNNASA